MITQTKSATKPLSAKQIAASEQAALRGKPKTASAAAARQFGPKLPSAKPITDVDREEALAAIGVREPSLALDCQRAFVDDAASDLVKNRLYLNCVGQWLYSSRLFGGPQMAADEDGISVQVGDRRGFLTWLEIAESFRDEEDQAEEERASGGPAVPADNVRKQSPRKSRPAASRPPEASSSDTSQIQFSESTVSHHQIDISPDNPRRHFDEASIDELAASIRVHGLLQPLVVRRKGEPHRYELIAGERRLRAIRKLGINSVHVRVGQMSDVQAAELRVIENLQREDLNEVEEAEALQELITRHGRTQDQLAQQLGKSQPHVAGRLALLKLTQVWREKIIARVITPTHARALLPWADKPALLDTLAKELFGKTGSCRDGVGNHVDFAEQVDDAIRYDGEVTENLDQAIYDHQTHRSAGKLTLSPEQLAKLDVIELPHGVRQKGFGRYATNLKEFKKIEAAHLAAFRKQNPAPVRGKAAKAAKPKGKAKPLSQKQLAQQGEAADKKLALAVDEWRESWIHYLLAERTRRDRDFAERVLLLILVAGEEPASVTEVAAALGVKRLSWGEKASAALAASDVNGALRRLTTLMLWDGQRRGLAFDDVDIMALARLAKLDLPAEWKRDAAGPLTAGFFELHDDRQLQRVASELRLDLAGCKTRKDRIARLTKAQSTKATMPAVIEPIKPPAAKKNGKRKSK